MHPYVEGVDHVGVGFYDACDLDSLGQQIGYWLDQDDEREHMRRQGFERVKNHETYTDRSRELLEVVFGHA